MAEVLTGEIVDPLTDDEYADFERCETTIEKGRQTFLEVGAALAEIKERRLYRQYHPSFDAYCREQWEMGKSQAYRLIDAAEIVTELETSPIGDTPLPKTESQARELSKVPAEDRAAVMREASEDGPATAPKIKEVVEKRTDTPAKGREVRTETVETEPLPPSKRSVIEERVAEKAHRAAEQLSQTNRRLIDEKTIRLLEVVCERWRNQ